jgi:ubiquinone biosynthesis protein
MGKVMGISLRASHLGRYRDLARLLLKYGRSDMVKHAGLEEALLVEDRAEHPSQAAEAEELAADLERLGPTYIKLGQLLSTRSDILPAAHLAALARLQDKVDPFPVAQAEQIIEEQLGVRMSKAFVEFDARPIAAASLGQVHRAVLRDGKVVAVKVQRPDIRTQIDADLEVLAEIAAFLDERTDAGRRLGFSDMVDEFRRSLIRELDYIQEANHLEALARNMSEFPRIVVPRPFMDLTTTRVLTMEFVHGRKITALSPLRLLELDGAALGEELFQAYLKQILVDGLFHADPHPGNVFLTDDDSIALIDLGMIGRVTPQMQDKLLRLLLAISNGNGEKAADFAVEMGQTLPDFDAVSYTRGVSQLVAEHRDSTINQIEVGRVVMEITRTAATNGVRLPAELTLLGKTLLNLDQVARTLAPDFNPQDAIQRHATEILRRRVLKAVEPANLFTNVLELTEFIQELPARMNTVLDRIASNEIEVRVHAIDEEALVDGIQKVANRITMGLVLAAMIVGAAMLMNVETEFTILGYPALAILLFLGAAAGGVLLVIDIWLHDRSVRRRVRDRRD